MTTEFESGVTEISAAKLREILEAVGASNFERAYQLADVEISQGAVHPALYNARAMWLERQGRDVEALDDYTRARAIAPRNVHILNALGLCYMRLSRGAEAVETFDDAIRAEPLYIPSYTRKGIALSRAGNLAGATAAHERAIGLDPRNAESLASLATIAAQKGAIEKAKDFATRALRIDPGQATAIAALAQCENSERNFISAEKRVAPLLDDPRIVGFGRAGILGILADALDGQDRTDEAFSAYSAENAELLRLSAVRFAGSMRIADLCEGLLGHLQGSAPNAFDSPSPAKSGDAPSGHVFLMGFYRSGTTLLEQVLEAHPGIVTVEEADFLQDDAEHFLTNARGLRKLEALSGEQLEAVRRNYWQKVGRVNAKAAGNIFVDKNPLNTVKLPLIAKLFPDAKILFALRDPRDVVLSCFRRHFQINAAMYELLTLHGAARAYNGVMRLADAMRQKTRLPFHECRYEGIVNDFENSVRDVCHFIGVEYTDDMARFSTVQRSDEIRSPSALQVRRELNREGLDQWRRYARHIEDVAPLLGPWVEHFGYPAQ